MTAPTTEVVPSEIRSTSISMASVKNLSIKTGWSPRHIYTENYDLRDNNSASVVPAGGVVPNDDPANGGAASSAFSDDGADWWMSVVQIEVAADLTDNVSVVVNLFNQRDWNAHEWEESCSSDLSGVSGGGCSGASNVSEEFDIGVDLAYVQMKEIFYAPLTITIGRQDIEFGRGLVFGNFQIQDPQSGIIADEYSAVTSFDAFRATLDFEPWTVDFVVTNPAQGGGIPAQGDPNDEDDRYFWFANVNYQFSEYNAEWEGYFGLDHDRASNSAEAAEFVYSNAAEKTYVIGTRAQFDPVENLTVGAEVAYQWGDFYGGTNTVANPEVDRDAWMGNIFGAYTWNENEYTPWFGLEFVHFSGDEIGSGENEGWNGLFRSPTYGLIRDYLDVIYATALTSDSTSIGGAAGPVGGTNHEHFSVSGGLSPMDDLSIDLIYYWFWMDEDTFVGVGGLSPDRQKLSDDVGNELDVNLTYAYTEDVTFGLTLGWFMPGDVYDDYRPGTTRQGSEDFTNGETDGTATLVTTSVAVVF